jgi:hypothetical protein
VHRPKTCEQCGTVFSPPYRVTAAYWAKRQFCSARCGHDARRGQPNLKNAGAKRSLAEQAWEKVDVRGPDECWPWTGARFVQGYGKLVRTGRTLRASRVIFELAKGPIPKGLNVLHTCDNPPCCNPAHLYAGTKRDNARDRADRGRGRENRQSGEKNTNAALCERDVVSIERLARGGRMSQMTIAQAFGVSQQTVSRIANHVTWLHLWAE